MIARASVASLFWTGINTVTTGESGIGWPAWGSGGQVIGAAEGGGGLNRGQASIAAEGVLAGVAAESWTGIDRGHTPDRAATGSLLNWAR